MQGCRKLSGSPLRSFHQAKKVLLVTLVLCCLGTEVPELYSVGTKRITRKLNSCRPTNAHGPLIHRPKKKFPSWSQILFFPSLLHPPRPTNRYSKLTNRDAYLTRAASHYKTSFGRKSPDTFSLFQRDKIAVTRRHRSRAADLLRTLPSEPVPFRPVSPLRRGALRRFQHGVERGAALETIWTKI